MKTIIHRVLAATTLLAGVAAGTIAVSAPAQASSCGPGTNAAGQTVYYCSIWTPSGGTPVYSSTSTGSTIVGRLYTAGSANWFYCQQNGSTASVGGYSSSNWARTKADNGATGWVPATYYTGSEPYWPGMPTCATSTPTTSTQKIVNHTFYGQINGYYCGPASTQIALSSWGRSYSQDYLASRLGTTINGTDSISQVASVLNSLTASSYYQVTWIGGDYASATQKAALKTALVNDVNQGRALVANVVGYATSTDGRTHSYSGGHYLAVTGYSQSGTLARISDNAYGSASSGEYWMTTDRLADWIAGRGYAA
jgi:hypothetical protein